MRNAWAWRTSKGGEKLIHRLTGKSFAEWCLSTTPTPQASYDRDITHLLDKIKRRAAKQQATRERDAFRAVLNQHR